MIHIFGKALQDYIPYFEKASLGTVVMATRLTFQRTNKQKHLNHFGK